MATHLEAKSHKSCLPHLLPIYFMQPLYKLKKAQKIQVTWGRLYTIIGLGLMALANYVVHN